MELGYNLPSISRRYETKSLQKTAGRERDSGAKPKPKNVPKKLYISYEIIGAQSATSNDWQPTASALAALPTPG